MSMFGVCIGVFVGVFTILLTTYVRELAHFRACQRMYKNVMNRRRNKDS